MCVCVFSVHNLGTGDAYSNFIVFGVLFSGLGFLNLESLTLYCAMLLFLLQKLYE